MSEVIDRKFVFLAVNPCNGNIYTQVNGMVFAAKDRALLPTLHTYRRTCEVLGCEASHLESVDLLIGRVRAFQIGESRIPDTDTQCEIDRCIGGKI